jgi:pantoate--beta-alanine ligase
MRTTESVEEVRDLVSAARRDGRRIGCVPTMGALHRGHTSLISSAVDDCQLVVVTLFVNSPQFDDPDDFHRYPRPLEDDLATCQELGVDVVFAPDAQTVYPPGGQTTIDVGPLGRIFEGYHRPDHFLGVATVVVKLLNITTPDVAYFGRKDFQQQLVIRRLCRDLHLPVEIVTCSTVRDSDGLALSSRNVLLSPDQRIVATSLFRALKRAEDGLNHAAGNLQTVRGELRDELGSTPGLEIDYATIVDAGTLEETDDVTESMVALVAGSVGGVRLIDNLPLSTEPAPSP